MSYQYHDETIVTELPEDTIFVFGSNLAGQHDSGAARVAAQHFAAVKGVGRGWAGQSFAIPTLNEHLQQMPRCWCLTSRKKWKRSMPTPSATTCWPVCCKCP